MSLLALVPFCNDKAAYVEAGTEDLAADSKAGPQWMSSIKSKRISFVTNEGTFMNIDVSPDGATLAFDLLGDIYLLPIRGGTPTSLTSGPAWDQAPLFSADGSEIYFISDRLGAKNIWKASIRDSAVRRLTASKSDIVGALNWTSDRRRIIAGRGNIDLSNAEVSLYTVDPHSGTMDELQRKDGPWIDLSTFQRLRRRIHTFSGTQSSDGTVYYSEASFNDDLDRFTVRLYGLDEETGVGRLVSPPNAPYNDYAPQTSSDGEILAWFRQYPDRRTELRVRNLVSQKEKAVAEFEGADDPAYGASHAELPRYAFTPDGRYIVLWHTGKIWRVSIEHGSARQVPFELEVEREVQARANPVSPNPFSDTSARIIRWPSLSTDGRWLTFSAFGYIWIKDLQSSVTRRLTCSSEFEYMPAISPDGRSIAYVAFSADHPEYFSARLMVVDRSDGKNVKLLAGDNEAYLLPRWSQDREMIAVIRETNVEGSIKAEFGWTPSTIGSFNGVAAAPPSSDRTSLSLASRYVGFDASGERLLFSYPKSENEAALASSDLAGTQSRVHVITDENVVGITPAPDMRSVLLTGQNASIWLLPLKSSPNPIEVSVTNPAIRPISRRGGYYASWSTSDRFTYSLGKRVFDHELGQVAHPQSVEVSIDNVDNSQIVAFRGGRIITMSGSHGVGPVIDNGVVVIRGRYIVDVGPMDSVEIPPDAVVINSSGMTIIPGLVDAHYHRAGGSAGTIGMSALKLPNATMGDPSAITYGITTAWEPGGIVDDGSPATADLQRAGRILGPRWTHSASGAVGYPWNQLTTYDDARRAVTMQKQLGATVLKEYSTPTRLQRQWLSAAARAVGVSIYSHLQSFDGAMTSIVDGYSGGEHSYIPVPYFKDISEMMRQTGYIWTPNVVISSGSVAAADVLADIQDQEGNRMPGRRKHQGNTAASNDHDLEDGTHGSEYPLSAHRASRVAEQAASAAKLGISIGVSGHSMPGVGIHAEMWHLWKGGMPVLDVLRAATVGNAAKLGLGQHIGSLEPGKIADFLILERDPLINILNANTARFTVQGGNIYDSGQTDPILWNGNVTSAESCITRQ